MTTNKHGEGMNLDITREECIKFIKKIPTWNEHYEVSVFMANNKIMELEDEIKRLTRPTSSMTPEEREKVVDSMVRASCYYDKEDIMHKAWCGYMDKALAALEQSYRLVRKEKP